VTRSTIPAPQPTAVQGSTESEPTLGRADRYQPVVLIGAIGAGLGLAKAWPALAGSLSPLVSGGVLVLIFLVMLKINVGQVANALTERRFLGIAIAVNFVLNPLVAWGLANIFLSAEPDLKTGLILFLVTPCIGWYLIFTELAGGDAALGVSLLGVNLVLQILLLPFYLYLFLGQASAIDLPDIILSVALFLVLPAVAASATRAGLHRSQFRLEVVQSFIDAAHLKTVALVVVIVAMFASQADVLFDNPGVVVTLLPPMLAFFALAFGIACVAGRVAGLSYDQTALLVFTSTSRNSEASLAIAATAFVSPLVGLTVVIGPVIELPLLVLMVRVLLTPRVRSAITPVRQRTGLRQ